MVYACQARQRDVACSKQLLPLTPRGIIFIPYVMWSDYKYESSVRPKYLY